MKIPSEQEIRAFVGPNADYYLKKWQPLLSGQGGGAGFNIAALFFTGLWLAYRKMWKATFILYGIIIAVTLLEEILFTAVLKQESPAALSRLVGLVFGIACGAGGNRWYFAHTTAAIAEARGQGLVNESSAKAPSRQGGTGLGAALGIFILFLGISVGLVIVLALLFGQV